MMQRVFGRVTMGTHYRSNDGFHDMTRPPNEQPARFLTSRHSHNHHVIPTTITSFPQHITSFPRRWEHTPSDARAYAPYHPTQEGGGTPASGGAAMRLTGARF